MPNTMYRLRPQDWLLHDEDASVDDRRLQSQVNAGWYMPRLSITIKNIADQLELIDPDAQSLLMELAKEVSYVHEHYALKPRSLPSRRDQHT